MLKKHTKMLLTTVALSSMMVCAAPLTTTIHADSARDSAAISLTGHMPDKTIEPTADNTRGDGVPQSNAELQRVQHHIRQNAGDVQTGVTQQVNATTSTVAILGIITMAIAGYISGLRLKLYRKE